MNNPRNVILAPSIAGVYYVNGADRFISVMRSEQNYLNLLSVRQSIFDGIDSETFEVIVKNFLNYTLFSGVQQDDPDFFTQVHQVNAVAVRDCMSPTMSRDDMLVASLLAEYFARPWGSRDTMSHPIEYRAEFSAMDYELEPRIYSRHFSVSIGAMYLNPDEKKIVVPVSFYSSQNWMGKEERPQEPDFPQPRLSPLRRNLEDFDLSTGARLTTHRFRP